MTGGQIDFRPMPKRFMVWDKELSEFRKNDITKTMFFDIVDLGVFLTGAGLCGEDDANFVIVQSTNLFDKNYEEIFEGSILQAPDGSLSVVEYDDDEAMFRTNDGSVLDDMSCGGDYFKVVGHVLSNPELLEGKNV